MKKTSEALKKIAKSLSDLAKQLQQAAKKLEKAEASGKSPAKAAARKAPAAKTQPAPAGSEAGASVLETVFDVVKRSRKGASISKLKEKTGLSSRQLSNALYKLSKRGRIETKSRGIYVKK